MKTFGKIAVAITIISVTTGCATIVKIDNTSFDEGLHSQKPGTFMSSLTRKEDKTVYYDIDLDKHQLNIDSSAKQYDLKKIYEDNSRKGSKLKECIVIKKDSSYEFCPDLPAASNVRYLSIYQSEKLRNTPTVVFDTLFKPLNCTLGVLISAVTFDSIWTKACLFSLNRYYDERKLEQAGKLVDSKLTAQLYDDYDRLKKGKDAGKLETYYLEYKNHPRASEMKEDIVAFSRAKAQESCATDLYLKAFTYSHSSEDLANAKVCAVAKDDIRPIVTYYSNGVNSSYADASKLKKAISDYYRNKAQKESSVDMYIKAFEYADNDASDLNAAHKIAKSENDHLKIEYAMVNGIADKKRVLKIQELGSDDQPEEIDRGYSFIGTVQAFGVKNKKTKIRVSLQDKLKNKIKRGSYEISIQAQLILTYKTSALGISVGESKQTENRTFNLKLDQNNSWSADQEISWGEIAEGAGSSVAGIKAVEIKLNSMRTDFHINSIKGVL